MDRVARLPRTDRGDLFRETAARRAMNPAVIEKDFWVCWVLKHLFTDATLGEHLVFKGGTSLSKVFGLIDRPAPIPRDVQQQPVVRQSHGPFLPRAVAEGK